MSLSLKLISNSWISIRLSLLHFQQLVAVLIDIQQMSSSIVMANEIKQWANDLATTGQLELEKTR